MAGPGFEPRWAKRLRVETYAAANALLITAQADNALAQAWGGGLLRRADFVNDITDATIDVHCRYGEQLPTGHSAMHIYPIDGAASRVLGSACQRVQPVGRTRTSPVCTMTRRLAPTLSSADGPFGDTDQRRKAWHPFNRWSGWWRRGDLNP